MPRDISLCSLDQEPPAAGETAEGNKTVRKEGRAHIVQQAEAKAAAAGTELSDTERAKAFVAEQPDEV